MDTMDQDSHYSFEQDVIERLTRIETMAGVSRGTLDDHEKRLRSVEKTNHAMMGIGGLLALLGTLWQAYKA